MTPITSLSSLSQSQATSGLRPQAATEAQKPFKDFMLQSLNEVNTMQQDADKAVQQLVTGGDVNAAEVLTTLQKADMSFKLMMQIRNKLVQAYQEVNNIRI
jgi:flagellar hook-basal body complex protein FliE